MAAMVTFLMMKLHSYYLTNRILKILKRDYVASSAGQPASNNAVPFARPAGSPPGRLSKDIRDLVTDKERFEHYPRNISLRNFLYFLAAPTLTYEPHYPKRRTIRWIYVSKEIFGCIGCCICVYVLAMQFVMPALRDHSKLYMGHLQALADPENQEYMPVFSSQRSAYVLHYLWLTATSIYEALHLSIPFMVMWLLV